MQKYSRAIRPAILVVYLILVVPMITRGHNWGDDFASYLMQAISIVQRTIPEFIQSNSFTIQHSTITLGPVAYPWGLPMLIAPIYAVFGLNLFAIKMLNVVVYTAFLILLFFLFENRLSITERLLIVCLFAFDPYLLSFHDNILSDLPFLFFSTLSIFLIDRMYSLGGLKSRSKLLAIATGISIFISIFTRTNGVLLLATLLIVQVVTNRNKFSIQNSGILLIPYICAGVLLLLGNKMLPSGGSGYLDQIDKINLETTSHHFFLNAMLLGSFWHMQSFLSPLNIVITILTGSVALIGFIDNARKDIVFSSYFILTYVFYMFVPFLQGLRFLFPIVPFFIYFFIMGINKIDIWLVQKNEGGESRFPIIIQLILVLVLFVQSLRLSLLFQSGSQAIEGPFDPLSTEMFQAVERRTPLDSVIIFFKPRAMHLLTERMSFYSNRCGDLSQANFLVENKKEPLMQPPVCKREHGLQNIFENQEFIVYQILPLQQ